MAKSAPKKKTAAKKVKESETLAITKDDPPAAPAQKPVRRSTTA